MKRLRIIIITCIVLILLIIGIMFFINRRNNIESGNIGDIGEEVNYDTSDLKDVDDRVQFFTVIDCVEVYLDQVQKDNAKYYDRNDEGEYVLIASQEEINEDIYQLLSKEYIEKNNITVENVLEYVDNIEDNYYYVPLKMKVLEASNTYKYVVFGFIQTSQNEFLRDANYVVNMDRNNKTFSIELLSNDYASIDDVSVENNNESIDVKDNNTFKDAVVTNEYVANNYFERYKRMCLTNTETAYEYLNTEYKNKRFGSLEEYISYVEANREELSSIRIDQYLVNNYDGYTEYVCKDQYDNYYIFDEQDINNFDVKLDTYTIATEKFIEQYNGSSDENKVKLNIDKWVKMINNRDYKNAFNYLDETFRNNNFNNDSTTFENYMRNQYPAHYQALYGDTTERSGVFAQNIVLRNIDEEESSEQNLDIIMSLQEDLNFVMSFTIYSK